MECLPESIPEKVKVSIDELELGEAIYISDLNLPDKLKIHNALTAPIVTVSLEKEEVKEEVTDSELAEEAGDATPEKASEKTEHMTTEEKSDNK